MKKGFTLVELIGVIVILGLVLVIAMPKINEVVENSKKNTFLALAKNVIRQLEYEDNNFDGSNLSNLNLGNIKLNNIDTENSYAYIQDDTVYVSLAGKNKYEGLYICNVSSSTKTPPVQTESCS